LVTTEPNEEAAKFHDRMPVVLSDDEAMEWLGDQPLADDKLMALCKGLPADALLHEVIPARPKEPRAPAKPITGELDLFG
jgi:putative SOS response-associated peptidase YedK